MKSKSVLLLLLSMTAHFSFAQDVIVKKDGSTIMSKVVKIGSSEVEYKKWSNQDGPLYTVPVSELLSINYQNGDKETFDAAPAQTSASPSEPQMKNLPPDARNAEIIKMYDKDYHLTEAALKKCKADKEAKTGVLFFTVDEQSVMSNEELEMSFVTCTTPHPHPELKGKYPHMRYNILLKNKTDKIIYIDLAACRRTSSLGEHRIYYTSEDIGVGHSSGGGASVGLGAVAGALGIGGIAGTVANGIGIGSGSSTTVSKNYTQMRVLSIPPRSTAYLTNFKYMEVKKAHLLDNSKYVLGEKAEEFCFLDMQFPIDAFCLDYMNMNIKRGIVNQGEEKEYSKENSPLVYDYAITYSTTNDFSTYSILSSTLYVNKVIGLSINNTFTETAIDSGYNQGGCNAMWKMWGTDDGMENNIENYTHNTICGPIQFAK